ncbi:MAG TPA: NAD(FAD)-dependent dehydrogenase, partial [Cyanobacteria bacterium UBA8553]|nr:NAD(FAD)-dependent dehydrogenase [Cyanobacteria bacterium UBA8553]
DNLLIGGKGIAVSHIVNAATRLHYGEWTFGAAAGATAGWLIKQPQSNLTPAQIVPKKLMPKLHQHLKKLGLRFTWE